MSVLCDAIWHAVTLELAASDQSASSGTSQGPIVLDEIQKAPDLFPAIKISVDKNRTPGRFPLTGSANVRTLPQVSESLTGQVEIIHLFPLPTGELADARERFVTRLFNHTLANTTLTATAQDLATRLTRGWDYGCFLIARKFLTAGRDLVDSRNAARVVGLGCLAFFFLAGGCDLPPFVRRAMNAEMGGGTECLIYTA